MMRVHVLDDRMDGDNRYLTVRVRDHRYTMLLPPFAVMVRAELYGVDADEALAIIVSQMVADLDAQDGWPHLERDQHPADRLVNLPSIDLPDVDAIPAVTPQEVSAAVGRVAAAILGATDGLL